MAMRGKGSIEGSISLRVLGFRVFEGFFGGSCELSLKRCLYSRATLLCLQGI